LQSIAVRLSIRWLRVRVPSASLQETSEILVISGFFAFLRQLPWGQNSRPALKLFDNLVLEACDSSKIKPMS